MTSEKKVVLALGSSETEIDPEFCNHENAFSVHEQGESWLECPDCNCRIFEDGEVVRVADEIPY